VGLRIDGPLFQLIAVPNGLAMDRFGVVAGRKLGRAVARNRSKRLLRESFRRTRREGSEALDLVLIPKKEILDRTADDVAREYRERLRRLAMRRFRRNSNPASSG
jgi:ribonuclease P protein component